MFKVETSSLEEHFATDPGRNADLRAVERRAGTAGDRTIGAAVRMGERGPL